MLTDDQRKSLPLTYMERDYACKSS